jgi:hypothetical protein
MQYFLYSPCKGVIRRTIEAEFKGAVSEEEKIVAITKIVLNLMKQNDHQYS